MKEYQSPTIRTEAEFDELQLQDWLADSHYWIVQNQTYVCKWCGKITTTVLQWDAHLCMKNPEIIKLQARKE
mgnify:CR=1 FL=1